MNILHTAEFYAPSVGGAQSVVQQLSERLARRGHRVCVATSKMPERRFTVLNGVEIQAFDVCGSHGRFIGGTEGKRYQEFLRAPGFDVMMNFAAQQWATDLAFATVEETSHDRANVIVPCGYSALQNARTLRWGQFAQYFTTLVPRVIPLYDAAVYNTTRYQDYEFGERAGFRNSVIIPNAADEAEFGEPPVVDFREKYGIRTRYLALCVANFFPGKGQERVLRCFRDMKRSDITLVFIGDTGSELARLRASAQGSAVRFLVKVPRADTVAAYHAADLFLFGSHLEASPLVIIEAKAARTPFVSTDCGNVAEWQGGVVCPAEDMAAQANRLLDTPWLRQQLADEGWAEWKDRLTWEAVTDRYEALYTALVDAKRNAVPPATHHFLPAPAAESSSGQSLAPNAPTAAIIFSKDRALQLEATLESLLLHCADSAQLAIHVLYTTSSLQHERQYRRLMEDYPSVRFVGERDFRAQTLELVAAHEAVLFLVDDNIFVRRFEVAAILAALDLYPQAIGFSLRLGMNTTVCYSHKVAQEVPEFMAVEHGFLKYRWPETGFDFGYPLEVSSSVYRSCNLLPLLRELPFKNPNTLEAQLAGRAMELKAELPELLCYPVSVAFCNPINRVQKVFRNRAGQSFGYSIRSLTRRYEKGWRIDVTALANHVPNGCHQEVPVQFVQRVRVLPEQWTGWPAPVSSAVVYQALQLFARVRNRVQWLRNRLWPEAAAAALPVPAVHPTVTHRTPRSALTAARAR